MLNSPKTIERLRQGARPNPHPQDWDPILDRIHECLRIQIVWTSLHKAKAKRGSSGIQMVFEDRTIFLSPRAERFYLPEWHDTCHAIIARERLDQPNFGFEQMPKEVTDQEEFDTQAIQMYLLRRFGSDPVKVRRCWRSFGYDDQEVIGVAERGRQLLVLCLPELSELFADVEE